MVNRMEVIQTECLAGAVDAGWVTGCTVNLQFRWGLILRWPRGFKFPARLDDLAAANQVRIRLCEMRKDEEHVDGLDADERDDDATDAVDEQVAAKERIGGLGLVFDAFECQRDERD